MLENLWNNVKDAPNQLRETPARIRAIPANVEARRTALQSDLTGRARRARTRGQVSLWRLQLRTLERADTALKGRVETPVVGWVAEPAQRVVHTRLSAVTALPVEGYEAMNAKTAAKSLRGLSPVELLQIERWELANKARKTVATALEAERARQNA
jgi:hypothetical protein